MISFFVVDIDGDEAAVQGYFVLLLFINLEKVRELGDEEHVLAGAAHAGGRLEDQETAVLEGN